MASRMPSSSWGNELISRITDASFLITRADRANELDDFRSITPYVRTVGVLVSQDIDERASLISSLSPLAKISACLQFMIVVIQQGCDLHVRVNVFRHRLEFMVLNTGN